jgi:hypothetical protein
MANPTPKALQDAAASLRGQANAARDALDAQGRRSDDDFQDADDKASLRKAQAEALQKDAEVRLRRETDTQLTLAKDAAELDAKAAKAEASGDQTTAADLRRQAADVQARADGAADRAVKAQQDINQAKVEIAQADADSSNLLATGMRDLDKQDAVDGAIGNLEQQAKLLDEAGRKLALASIEDDIPKRADLELEAEKMIQTARGIQVDQAVITAATGQALDLPDLAKLPTDEPVADDTALMDPFADDPTSSAASTDAAADDSQAPAAADDVVGADATDVGTPAATTADPVAAADTATMASDAGTIVADATSDTAVSSPDFTDPGTAPETDMTDFAADPDADAAAMVASTDDGLDDGLS